MTDYIIEDDTGSSPSEQQHDEWYVSDLQLAAELGKTLLERNNEYELNIKQQQAVIDEQAQEIQFLSRQSAALKEVNDSRLRIYEQLEVNVSDLEKLNQKLQNESSYDKKRIKSLCSNIDVLETKCEELQKIVDDLKMAERLKKRERNRTVVPVLEVSRPTDIIRRRFSIENGATAASESSEDFEVAKLRASVSRFKSQLTKEERKSADLEEQVNVLVQDNSNLHQQVQLLQEQQERLSFYHQAERLYLACHKCRHNINGDNEPHSMLEAECESEEAQLKGECTLVELKNGALAYGSQESLLSVGREVDRSTISQRNCISLLSELDAQYRAVIEKYEELLRARRNSDVDNESEMNSMDHNGHIQTARTLSEELSEASDLSLSSGFSESSDRSLIDQGVQTEFPKCLDEPSPVSTHFNHSPPEYKALFQEIFTVLNRSVPEKPAISDTTPVAHHSQHSAATKKNKPARKFYKRMPYQHPPFLSASPSLVGFPVIRLPGCLSYAEVLSNGSKRGRPLYMQAPRQ